MMVFKKQAEATISELQRFMKRLASERKISEYEQNYFDGRLNELAKFIDEKHKDYQNKYRDEYK